MAFMAAQQGDRATLEHLRPAMENIYGKDRAGEMYELYAIAAAVRVALEQRTDLIQA
jgi:hypothetical protein